MIQMQYSNMHFPISILNINFWNEISSEEFQLLNSFFYRTAKQPNAFGRVWIKP